jgi:hypothetical protein
VSRHVEVHGHHALDGIGVVLRRQQRLSAFAQVVTLAVVVAQDRLECGLQAFFRCVFYPTLTISLTAS